MKIMKFKGGNLISIQQQQVATRKFPDGNHSKKNHGMEEKRGLAL